MSQIALHTLVGTALTDSKFCHDLLNGRRHSLLPEFDFTDEEQEAVLTIQADSIQAFAAQLCQWLKAEETPISYPPTAVAVPYLPLRSPVGSAFWQRNLAPRQSSRSFAG
jgi:hypothetical protein